MFHPLMLPEEITKAVDAKDWAKKRVTGGAWCRDRKLFGVAGPSIGEANSGRPPIITLRFSPSRNQRFAFAASAAAKSTLDVSHPGTEPVSRLTTFTAF
jgi:hypothetical protein